MQVAYWASFCAVMSYATVFLLSLGYSSAAAGAIIAAGNLAGILFQPLCAGLVPRAQAARVRWCWAWRLRWLPWRAPCAL